MDLGGILLVLGTSAIAIIEGVLDARRINKGHYVDHFVSASLRVAAISGLSFVIYPYYLDLIGMVITLLSIYWILFDLTINYVRGLPLFYIGRTSFIDRTIIKFGFDNGSFLILKCFAFLIGLFIFTQF